MTERGAGAGGGEGKSRRGKKGREREAGKACDESPEGKVSVKCLKYCL